MTLPLELRARMWYHKLHEGELIELREARGLSQAQLAEMIGVDGSTLSRWEAGLRRPRTEQLVRLVEALAATA